MSSDASKRDFTAGPLDLGSLKSRMATVDGPLDETEVVSMLRACSIVEDDLRIKSDPEHPPHEVQTILKDFLAQGHVKMTVPIVTRFFMPPNTESTNASPSSTLSLAIIDQFNKDNAKIKSTYIPQTVAMVPFRRAAYGAEFDTALEIMDKTVGSQSLYQRYVLRNIRRFWSTWTLGTSSIVGGTYGLLQSGLLGNWDSVPLFLGAATIPSMVFTYIASLTLYGILSMSGRISKSGDVLEWSKGTRTSYRYHRAAEMQMASLLTQVNMSLRENQGECSLHLIKQLQKRSMDVVVPEQEEMLREYWARGGEGFEWIEPDQDPAEVIWRTKMERAKPSRIGSPYSRAHSPDGEWTDQVLNTLPHASLIQPPPASPDKLLGPGN